ncbi:MAG: nucleoside-diphosphate sugar epimerase/dehydratase [Opitutales bacterium]
MWLVPLKLVFLFAFGQFEGLLSYFRLPDMSRIFAALSIVSAYLVYLWYLFDGEDCPPRSVILADLLFSLIFIGGMRMVFRLSRERLLSPPKIGRGSERVAIIGAGDAGASLAADLLSKPGLGMRPIVFLDDDVSKHHWHIHGIHVIGKPEALPQVKEKLGIRKVVLALPSASRKRIKELVDLARENNIVAQIVPPLSEIATGKVLANQVRPVELEDLLGRDPVALDSEQIEQLVSGKTVMVTGAGGSIGSELCRQIAAKKAKSILLIEQSEVQLFPIEQELIQKGYGGTSQALIADILDEERMRYIFERFKPDIVFHAAAHKHVPLMEAQPSEALKNNTLGTACVAALASQYAIERFVLISTDKAINPTSMMGASKRMAELVIQSYQAKPGNRTQFMAVRFGNVLGSSGSVIPVFKKQIAEGGPVTVTHPDVTRYFMTIPEAVGLVLQSATLGHGGEIFVLDMGEPIKIIDVAKQLIELSGFRPEIDIAIQFVGLRPGEKLYEELQHNDERLGKTEHPRVRCLLADWKEAEFTDKKLKQIKDSLITMSRSELKCLLQDFVPEYTPFFED